MSGADSWLLKDLQMIWMFSCLWTAVPGDAHSVSSKFPVPKSYWVKSVCGSSIVFPEWLLSPLLFLLLRRQSSYDLACTMYLQWGRLQVLVLAQILYCTLPFIWITIHLVPQILSYMWLWTNLSQESRWGWMQTRRDKHQADSLPWLLPARSDEQ